MKLDSIHALSVRPLLGYPNAQIALFVDLRKREYRVEITDPQGVIQWLPTTKADASSMYVHPFCHGYNYRPAAQDTPDLSDCTDVVVSTGEEIRY